MMVKPTYCQQDYFSHQRTGMYLPYSPKSSECLRRNRQYEVRSMDVETFETSQHFLDRYRLLALMEDIVLTDVEQIPIRERSIDYFVSRYLERYAFTNYHRHHRHLYDPSDSDVDDDGTTTTPRHPRHIPRSEVINHFAAHSEWILVDQLAKRAEKRVIDVIKWEQFCYRVREGRREARKYGVRWGLPHGDVVEEDFTQKLNLQSFPMHGKNIEKLLERARKKDQVSSFVFK